MIVEKIFDDITIPIVFAFNNEYCKYFSVALQSLIENSNINKKYDAIAIISEVSEYDKKLLLSMLPTNFSLRFFNISDCIPEQFKNIKFKTLEYYTEEIYYRLFIPFLFQNYKKVLYLDSDLVVECDINEFDTDIKEKQIAAALDTIVPFLETQPERLKHIKSVLKLKNEFLYFNSGVLLFNNEKIDLEEYSKALLMAFNIDELLFPDQDILNKIFQGKVKFIPRKWNFNSSPYVNDNFYNYITGKYKEDFLNARKNPAIIHFTSKYKPWNSNKNENYDRFWKYARKTPFYEEILYARTQSQIVTSSKYMNLYLSIKNGSEILLWGASKFLEEFIKSYKINTPSIIGIVDSDISKSGQNIGTYPIYSPEYIKNLNFKEVIITIINADYSNEIKSFLDANKINAKLTNIF